MNLLLIHDAVAAYAADASDSDRARLEFFEGLFELQQQRADAVSSTMSYEGLSREEADEAYAAYQPLLEKAPVSIDEVQFFGACKQMADYLCENAGLEDEVADALRGVDWYKLARTFDLELAGSKPAEFVEGCLANFD
ncbi:MAG: hypothetical protein J5818_04655, partial [Eggerthellaceae bacterium]|nr:hypothetical protein [Eggerthellaceae bacterium]